MNTLKSEINTDAQYVVVLKEPATLGALPNTYLPAGTIIQLIGKAAIEVYGKIDKITLVDDGGGDGA
jgi:hypothetical protein